LGSGAHGWASVPSGASTGRAEAVELRDGDISRYGGLGCRRAVANINGELNKALRDQSITTQRDLDQKLIALDGTPDKSCLGANAILAVSLAFARACAAERRIPLFPHLAEIVGLPPRALPRPTINLFSGGKHAGGQVPIQDVLVVPLSARTFDDSLAAAYAVYQAAAALCAKKYGMRALVADEGGLAPPFPSADAMLDDAVESIRAAGFSPGKDVAIAVDVAASHFYRDGFYHLGDEPLTSLQMVDQIRRWTQQYPIISVEDGLAEEDWQHWPALRTALGESVLVMGDDLLCTNPQRITRAIESSSANALLLKVNQIGTLTEAAHAYQLARNAGWSITISARSGETEDDWLADLAVGWSADFIKIGSITRSERLAKYNRLLAIEEQTGMPVASRQAGA
jgi:enolase